jgi:hypothetical protein
MLVSIDLPDKNLLKCDSDSRAFRASRFCVHPSRFMVSAIGWRISRRYNFMRKEYAKIVGQST